MYSLTSLWHTIGKRVVILLFVSFMALASVFTFAPQPSYAQIPLDSKATGQTTEELTGRSQDAPYSSEEKIDNAYTYRRATGMIEEDRQLNSDELANQAKNPRVFKGYDETTSDDGLLDKARDFVENITGQ